MKKIITIHQFVFVLAIVACVFVSPLLFAQYCTNGVPVACYEQNPAFTYNEYQTIMTRCISGAQFWDDAACTCGGSCAISPVLVDLRGDGFNLTSAPDGVLFDINADGLAERVSWTATGADDAFLVLDRNDNGIIDDGRELFGNFTEQTRTANPNGFAALSEFDKPLNGGNGDGLIDRHDTVFVRLRLWVDGNHNGKSEPNELLSMASCGITSLSLDFKKAKRVDSFGNVFWYRATVDSDTKPKAGKWAYDVLLVMN